MSQSNPPMSQPKLSKNGLKLRQFQKAPSAEKMDKIKQRREEKKTKVKITKQLVRISPQIIGSGVLAHIFYCGSNITVYDLITMASELAKLESKMYLSGPKRLAIRDMVTNIDTTLTNLQNWCILNKEWYTCLKPIIDIFKCSPSSLTTQPTINSIYQLTNPVDQLTSNPPAPLTSIPTKPIKCTKCELNFICAQDCRTDYVMNRLRNDGIIDTVCAKCRGCKIYQYTCVPAGNYAKCSEWYKCNNIFYVAIDYKGDRAKCPECRG